MAPTPSNFRNPRGALIVNADDWGRNRETTDRILACACRGTVSAASAMVFMEDSERAAALALTHGLETGLHLNLTTQFSAAACSPILRRHLDRVATYLRRHRLAQVVFHPGLTRAFEYLVAVQLDEYHRLFEAPVRRLDGHHHMHLCANVLIQRLLPEGVIVRRSFHFDRGEKSMWNRLYRSAVDRILARRHHLADFFFSLDPVIPGRLQKIYELARRSVVELATHPVLAEDYRYLGGDGILREIGDVPIVAPSAVRWEYFPVRAECL